MISDRPPNAAAGSPPPITLPNVIRSPATPSRPYQPDLVPRNPVSTSSMMSSEPCSAASAASTSLNPGSGGTTPMFAGHASVIRHAIRGPCAANTPATAAVSLYGSTSVSAAAAPVTPGLSGRANVATPGPPRGQRRAPVPGVAAGKLPPQAPAGERAGQPHRGHRRLGTGIDQPDLVHRGPRRDLLGKLDLSEGGGTERSTPARRRGDRGHHCGIRVAEDHRAPRADQVHVL